MFGRVSIALEEQEQMATNKKTKLKNNRTKHLALTTGSADPFQTRPVEFLYKILFEYT